VETICEGLDLGMVVVIYEIVNDFLMQCTDEPESLQVLMRAMAEFLARLIPRGQKKYMDVGPQVILNLKLLAIAGRIFHAPVVGI